MKSKIATLALLLMVGAAFGQSDEQGTVINGIEWATKNVAKNGSFAEKPDTCGYYYQWNQAVGWPRGSNMPWSGTIIDYEFKANPCPEDWRLPTWGEVHSLRDMYTRGTWAPAKSIKGNSVAGRFMGPNHANATISNPGAAVFMPACGIFWGGNNVSDPSSGYYYYHAIADGSKGGSWWFDFQANGGAGFEKYCAMQLRCIRAEWLTIDGIEWAKSNITTPGVFATKPDMQTEFYQWGRNVAHPATGSVTGWNTTPETSITTWTDDPCPENWRLPTYAEFQALEDEGYWWAYAGDMGNAVDGVFLGRNAGNCTLPDNMAGCVFFAANGARRNNGAIYYPGMSAYYWSREQVNANNGRGYGINEMGPGSASPHKAWGYNIRCVHDVTITAGDTSSSSTSSASISSITWTNYSRAMANYSRVPVDTIVEGVPSVHTETSNQTPSTNIYPNPVTNGELTIDNGELAIGVVEVRNREGAVVRTQDFGSQTTGTLQLHGLYGTYFVKVGSNMQSIVVAR